jgi:alpha-tubulin suppressor-like RCC1 family protein
MSPEGKTMANRSRGGREATPFGEVSKRYAHIFPLICKYEQVGQVFVVGSGDCGQLGLGPDVFEKERPAKLEYFDDKNIVAVFAGGLHNMALSIDGKVKSTRFI